MTLIDLLRSPWAIMPDRLQEIQAIYATHLRGEKIDIAAIEAKLGRPLANEQRDYEMRQGGIAVLGLQGAISPKANLFTKISGGASADVFAQQVYGMLADPAVKGAVIDVDSPGGNVLGIPAAGDALRAFAAEKPLATVSTGLMASAGYWIGSSANKVYASGATDMIGSIGVVATHTYDPTRRGAAQVTEVTAGKYKRMASDSGPLSPEGRAYMQDQVDELYAVFVQTVAENRGASIDDVLANMADGRVFIGRQAADAGLIDGFMTVDDAVESMATDPKQFAKRGKAVFVSRNPSAGVQVGASESGPVLAESSPLPTQEISMTPQELAAKFAAESPEAAKILRAEGASAEVSRVQAVRAAALPGHEKLIEALAADGKTSGAEAAMAVIAAERERTAAGAAAHLAQTQAPVKTEAAPVAAAPVAAQTYRTGDGNYAVDPNAAAFDAKVRAHMAAAGCDYLTALRAVANAKEAV